LTQQNNINRRSFLKTATGVAAGAVMIPYYVPASALGADGGVSASNRIVAAVIGTGSRGGGDMRSFMSKKEVQMVAVCDVDKSRLDKAKESVDKKYGNSDCKTYGDFRDVIGRGDLDVVVLALPDQWHSIPAIAAARAGLDIHAQKPLARTITEGRAICDAVKRYGVVWQTGSQQRSTANFHRACELVRNGRIGKVLKVEVGLPTGKSADIAMPVPVPEGLDWDMWLGPAPWRPYCNFGRRGVHWDFDIAHWGLGLERTGPVEIEGRGVYPKDGLYNTPTEYRFTCKYANGVTMTVANNKQLLQGAKWYGENGKWIYVNRGKLEANPASVLDEVIGPDEIRLYESRDHTQNFLDCVKTRKETVAPAEIGHRSISVGLLGEIAMLTESKLRWNPDKEVFLNNEKASRLLSRPMRSPWHI